MNIFERIQSLIRNDLALFFTDTSPGLWRIFLYVSFAAFVVLLFSSHLLPDWSFPFRKTPTQGPQDQKYEIGPYKHI